MYTLNGHRFSETEPNVWNTNDPPPPDLDVCVTLNRVDDFPRAVLPATVGQQAGQIKGRSPICEQLRDHTAAKNKCVLLLLHTAKRSAKDHSRSQDKVISHNYKQKYVQRKPVFLFASKVFFSRFFPPSSLIPTTNMSKILCQLDNPAGDFFESIFIQPA